MDAFLIYQLVLAIFFTLSVKIINLFRKIQQLSLLTKQSIPGYFSGSWRSCPAFKQQ